MLAGISISVPGKGRQRVALVACQGTEPVATSATIYFTLDAPLGGTDSGPKMGAFAAFADPIGNEFGLYEESQR